MNCSQVFLEGTKLTGGRLCPWCLSSPLGSAEKPVSRLCPPWAATVRHGRCQTDHSHVWIRCCWLMGETAIFFLNCRVWDLIRASIRAEPEVAWSLTLSSFPREVDLWFQLRPPSVTANSLEKKAFIFKLVFFFCTCKTISTDRYFSSLKMNNVSQV